MWFDILLLMNALVIQDVHETGVLVFSIIAWIGNGHCL